MTQILLRRITISTVLALLILPVSSIVLSADVWIDIGLTFSGSFTDGAGVERNVSVTNASIRSGEKSTVAVFALNVDGQKRFVSYFMYDLTQARVSSYLTAQDRIDVSWVQAAREAARLKRPGGKSQQMWVMHFGNETLYGKPGMNGQTSTAAADPYSFAALSFDPLKNPAIQAQLKNADDEDAVEAVKFLGKIFKGKLGAKCVKRTIETLKCNANCTAGQDGKCPCECMGMPCCSDCTKTTETVREYNVEGEAGAGIGLN